MAIDLATPAAADPARARGGRILGLRCRNCGAPERIGPNYVCASCFGPLEVAYDLDAVRQHLFPLHMAASQADAGQGLRAVGAADEHRQGLAAGDGRLDRGPFAEAATDLAAEGVEHHQLVVLVGGVQPVAVHRMQAAVDLGRTPALAPDTEVPAGDAALAPEAEAGVARQDRVGRQVLVSATLPGPPPALGLPESVSPVSNVWGSVGDRFNAGVGPLGGSARHAFGFLFRSTPEAPAPPPEAPKRGA